MQTDPDSDWFGKPMAVYQNLRMLAPENFITLKELRELFPDWFWVRRPQGSALVPDKPELQIRQPLAALLNERFRAAAVSGKN